MLITIFTPTYNRASLLIRLYESLTNLHYTNFEWIIVDDGSTDNTSELIVDFKKRASFPIHYVFQENAGKHIAINKGVFAAKGELFFIVDSDDRLTPEALSIVEEIYQRECVNTNLGGLALRGCYENGKIVGNSTFSQIICNSIDIRNIHGVKGDLVEIFLTRVMKEFPFPEIKNEKFCPEVLVWNRIAQHYDLVYVNEPIYVVEYQDGGLTDRIVKIRMTSPIASLMTYGELTSYDVPVGQKIKAAINFWRFSFNSSMRFSKKLQLIHPLFLPLLPLGLFYFIYDKYKQS